MSIVWSNLQKNDSKLGHRKIDTERTILLFNYRLRFNSEPCVVITIIVITNISICFCQSWPTLEFIL